MKFPYMHETHHRSTENFKSIQATQSFAVQHEAVAREGIWRRSGAWAAHARAPWLGFFRTLPNLGYWVLVQELSLSYHNRDLLQ